MNLVILHHHLNRGGVTQVIANHLRALATLPADEQPTRAAIVFDGQRDGWPEGVPGDAAAFPLELIVLPDLGYDAADAPADPPRLAQSIAAALAEHDFGPADTLLHFHNHSLGKNASLPGAIAALAGDGWRSLLQVHDFAEDNRPANYRRLSTALDAESPEALGGTLYPQAPHIHYATLTRRDALVLSAAGIAADRLDPLPNPAAEFSALPTAEEARPRVLERLELPAAARLIVYPVRGIRRKNLGEMLLLAALSPAETYLAVTLAPKNPAEYLSFDSWSDLARRLHLRCRFDTGGQYGVSYQEVLAAADAILTTSVAEGFGMVFLESWLAGRTLVGRDLPELTSEFRDEGLRFENLWPRVAVPHSLLDMPALRRDLTETYSCVCREYGVPALDDAALAARIETLFDVHGVDFGRLTPTLQARLIERCAADVAVRRTVLDANPFLTETLALEIDDSMHGVAANAAIVRDRYSTESVGQRLATAYRTLLSTTPDDAVTPLANGRAVLDHFVTPEQILPVRVETWTIP